MEKIVKVRVGGTYAQVFIILKTIIFLWKQNSKKPSIRGNYAQIFKNFWTWSCFFYNFFVLFFVNIVNIEH